MLGKLCGVWAIFLALLVGTAGVAGEQTIAKPVAKASEAPARAEPLDLNTATIAQLRTLPGIGEAYARRIVEGRPYTVKNQLATRGVLPQSAYEQIKDQVVAHHAAAP